MNKLTVMYSALRVEQNSRQLAEWTLNEVHTTIRELQAMSGHAILERDEAREAGRRSETTRLALTAALGAERTVQQTKQEGHQPAPESRDHAVGHRQTKPMPATASERGKAVRWW